MANNSSDEKQNIASKAQPGSQESGSDETNTKSGNPQVDVKDVLDTNETGQPPENVNNVSSK